MLEQSTALPWSKPTVRLCFDVCPTEPCHRIALNRLTVIADLPPGSILSPPSLLWLARVTGLFKVLPPTCRIVPESEKQKPSGSSFPHRSVASFEARKLEPKGSKCLAAMLDGLEYSRKKAPVKQGLNTSSWRLSATACRQINHTSFQRAFQPWLCRLDPSCTWDQQPWTLALPWTQCLQDQL